MFPAFFTFHLFKTSFHLTMLCCNNVRSNHLQILYKRGVLKNSAKSAGLSHSIPMKTRENLLLSSVFRGYKLAQVCNLIKNGRQHKCFSVNLAKLLRTPFFGRLSVSTSVMFLFASIFVYLSAINSAENTGEPENDREHWHKMN